MSETDAKKFQKEIESDADTFCIMEDNHNNIMSTPPTKMKNPGCLSHLKCMWRCMVCLLIMRSILRSSSVSPILFYLDLCLVMRDRDSAFSLVDFYCISSKKMRLAGIISCCGFFSTIFGVLFGSVFGFEDIIDAVWLRPQEA